MPAMVDFMLVQARCMEPPIVVNCITNSSTLSVMHSSALALYSLSLSMPMNCRPGIFAAAYVLPLPTKGSSILSSGSVNAPG